LSHLLHTTLASLIAPQAGASPNANAINTLYDITLYVALVIFVGVEGALLYALVKFRKRKGAVAAQIHGNTRLEIGWTAGAALIVVILSVITFVKLSAIQDPPNSDADGALVDDGGVLFASADKHLPPNGKSLNMQVIGRQFIWQYVYPGGSTDELGAPYSYTVMHVPTKTTVTLDIVSSDVIHSWWIPALGGKYQAVPGYHNYGWFKVEKPGEYRGQCANLCGRGHARMVAIVKAEEPAQFEAWLAGQKHALEEAESEAARERAKLNSRTGPEQVSNP
jgi:cytochrome c oxidase subunit II